MISHTTPRSDLKTISMGHSTGYNEMKELQQKCCLTFQHSRSCHSQQIFVTSVELLKKSQFLKLYL